VPPPFARVVVDIAKLRHYCLSDQHPRGRHKAHVFDQRLGLQAKDARHLQQALRDAARTRQNEFRPSGNDWYGQRYILDFVLSTAVGTATVRSGWIVRAGENVLRLVTCYVL
jgi:hypothetical protein